MQLSADFQEHSVIFPAKAAKINNFKRTFLMRLSASLCFLLEKPRKKFST
jgi:hypothetical protein